MAFYPPPRLHFSRIFWFRIKSACRMMYGEITLHTNNVLNASVDHILARVEGIRRWCSWICGRIVCLSWSWLLCSSRLSFKYEIKIKFISIQRENSFINFNGKSMQNAHTGGCCDCKSSAFPLYGSTLIVLGDASPFI